MATKDTFTTEGGLVLKLKPVREALVALAQMAVEQEFRERKEPIDVPTYTVMTVTGETQTFAHMHDIAKGHDTLTVEGDPKQTAQNFAAWGAYVAAQARLEEAQGEAAFMTQLEYGVEVTIDDMDMALLSKTMTKFGRVLPEDPDERKALWLVYFGLSRMDKNMLQMELTVATMGKLVKPDQVDSFRQELRRKVEGLASVAIGQAISRIGEMGGETEVPPLAGGAGVGPDPEPVG